MHSNQHTFIDIFDEFDWKMLIKNFNMNQREMDRFNNPTVFEGPTDEEIEMQMEWRNSHGE
jgi:hypothetical protein